VSNQVSIIMYHYVRDLKATRYPKIKGLELEAFRNQLDYFERFYQFVTVPECIAALRGELELPKNSVLLTFDDAILDHYTNVFPLLNERGIMGCFFPPARAVLENQMLDIHKIHFILSVTEDPDQLLSEVFAYMDEYRSQNELPENDYYKENFLKPMRFDHKNIGLIKKLLQRELPKNLRNTIVTKLFAKYVSVDERAFCEELYMSVDQIKTLQRNGMYVGSHCHDHVWLNSVDEVEQKFQIDQSLEFLRIVGAPTEDWVMCYPHGGYDESVINILKQSKCAMALAVEVGIADLSQDNAFTLKRLDTNDIPKEKDAEANEWTRKVLA